MQNAGLDKAQAGIKFAKNITITSDTQMTLLLMVESEEELKSLLMRVKGKSERTGLRPNI